MNPPTHRAAWPFVAAFILVLAAGTRLLAFDRYLPYVDYPDEANMFLLAVDWRGDFPLAAEYGAHLTGARLAGYPPLFPWLAVGTQRVVEAVSPKPFLFSGDYVLALRLVAVAAGVLTAAALLVVGWTLGGPVAAALAGLVWALSPVVVEWNSLAIPDPLVYLASAWTLACGLWAWHTDNPAWTLPALLAAIAAIYLKYVPLHVLVAWAVPVLVLLRRNWRRMLPWLIIELVIGLASAAYLVFGYNALRLENDEAMRVEPGMALDPERGLSNLYGALLPVGAGLFALVMLAAVFVIVWRRSGVRVADGGPEPAFRPDWRKAVYLLLVIFAGVLSVSTFIGIEPYSNQMRHVLPVSVAVIGLWALGVTQVMEALRGAGRAALAEALLTGLIVFFGVDALMGNAALVARFNGPDPRYELWRWSDASLPPEGKIMMFPDSRLRAVWNRPYSGYDGQTAFEWVFDAAPYRSTPESLYEQGVAYFALTYADWQAAGGEPQMAAFLDQLMPLRVFVAPPEQGEEHTIFFYRLLPPQVETDVHFGGAILMMGYDLRVTDDAVLFRPYWRTLARPAVNYSLFVHLVPPDSFDVLAQYDGAPAAPRRPAASWQTGEILVGADARIELPPGLPPGPYRLYTGLYDYETGQRLALAGGGDGFAIPLEIAHQRLSTAFSSYAAPSATRHRAG